MKKLGLLFVAVTSIVFTVSCVGKEVPVTETYYETEYRTEQYTDVEKVVTVVKGEDDLKSDKDWLLEDVGLWYHSYELPQHNTAQLVLDLPSRDSPYSSFRYTSFDVYVYDMTKVGHLPAWDMPVPHCIQYYYVTDPKVTWLDCNLTEEGRAQFEVWADSIDSKLESATLVSEVARGSASSWKDPPYIYNVTGIKTLAIIVETKDSGKLQAYPFSRSTKLVWSDVITEEKAVTKERQVPYQVEKQRTVMQTKKVPFWEAIFH